MIDKRSLSPARWALAAILAFGATSLAAHASGIEPVLPWAVLAMVALICVPFAVIFLTIDRLPSGSPSPQTWATGMLIAWFSLSVFHHYFFWPVAALGVIAARPRRVSAADLGPPVLACAAIAFGYAALWNANYLLVRYGPDVRWDPTLRDLDLTLYRHLLGRPADWATPDSYRGLFPLVTHPGVLRLFDNAYAILVPEIVMVAVLAACHPSPQALPRFMGRLSALYLVGLATFVVFPAIGPCLYYPESVDYMRSLSSVTFITGMLNDYRAVTNGGRLSGFGYFIAVPSLHVLAALYLQHWLRPFKQLFRIFLPINVTLIVSTVVLGYHYIFDVAASAAAFAAYLGFERWRDRHDGAPTGPDAGAGASVRDAARART